MPRQQITEKTVYTFDELSDRAKDTARDWFRQGMETADYADDVISECADVAAWLGIDIRSRPVRLMGGGQRLEPSVYWSLDRESFASIEGSYRYVAGGAAKAIAEWPTDTELHRIARELQAVQRRNFYKLYARMSHGREQTNVEVDTDGYARVSDADEEEMRDLLRDFASWIHARIQAEYDYRMSDETVAEDIRANEYEFDEEGRGA